jgi:anti-sigma factor RsiW
MSRDFTADIDRLGKQISDLRSLFADRAMDAADDATRYAAPKARQISRQLRTEGDRLARAAQRNPGVATGAIIGALAIGTVFGLFLASTSRSDD